MQKGNGEERENGEIPKITAGIISGEKEGVGLVGGYFFLVCVCVCVFV